MANKNVVKPKARDSLDISLNFILFFRIYKAFPETKIVKDTPKETVFRSILYFILIIYNLQHVIFAIQSIGNMDNFITVTLVLISTVNHLNKVITFHVYRDRIEKVIRVIEDPLFSPIFEEDYKTLEYYKIRLRILQNVNQASVYICVALWAMASVGDRLFRNHAVLPAYFPFSLEPLSNFIVAVVYKYTIIIWIGIGHVTLDCVMAAFYIQATLQIVMLKHALKRLTNIEICNNNINEKFRDTNNKYRTQLDNNFIYCIKKYEKIFWYVREVESIFNKAQFVQLAMSIVSLCVVLYKILGPINFDAMFLALYYITFLLQVFIFCYCGTLIHYESRFINNAIFVCDWISISPRFRKIMLISMLRWSRPITLFTANILPLSMDTYIKVLKLSYSLFTLLKQTSQ